MEGVTEARRPDRRDPAAASAPERTVVPARGALLGPAAPALLQGSGVGADAIAAACRVASSYIYYSIWACPTGASLSRSSSTPPRRSTAAGFQSDRRAFPTSLLLELSGRPACSSSRRPRHATVARTSTSPARMASRGRTRPVAPARRGEARPGPGRFPVPEPRSAAHGRRLRRPALLPRPPARPLPRLPARRQTPSPRAFGGAPTRSGHPLPQPLDQRTSRTSSTGPRPPVRRAALPELREEHPTAFPRPAQRADAVLLRRARRRGSWRLTISCATSSGALGEGRTAERRPSTRRCFAFGTLAASRPTPSIEHGPKALEEAAHHAAIARAGRLVTWVFEAGGRSTTRRGRPHPPALGADPRRGELSAGPDHPAVRSLTNLGLVRPRPGRPGRAREPGWSLASRSAPSAPTTRSAITLLTVDVSLPLASSAGRPRAAVARHLRCEASPAIRTPGRLATA